MVWGKCGKAAGLSSSRCQRSERGSHDPQLPVPNSQPKYMARGPTDTPSSAGTAQGHSLVTLALQNEECGLVFTFKEKKIIRE